jgi:hypothetical protein
MSFTPAGAHAAKPVFAFPTGFKNPGQSVVFGEKRAKIKVYLFQIPEPRQFLWEIPGKGETVCDIQIRIDIRDRVAHEFQLGFIFI